LVANGRFESTSWTAIALGPPLGGAAIGILGPVTTVIADGVSFALSALGIRAMGGSEPRPERAGAARLRAGDLVAGWRHILTSPALRPLFLNSLAVNALIMVSSPLLAVLMIGRLGFAPWQYALAFGAPCVGGLAGSRLARPLSARFGRHRVTRVAGAARACWPLGLAFVPAGIGGIALVIALQLGLVACIGVFNPLMATERLERTPPDLVARTLAAWSVSSKATIATLTALWGVLGGVLGPRAAIGLAGVLLLATPLLLPRRERAAEAPAVLEPA
jgi:hypothetical protein